MVTPSPSGRFVLRIDPGLHGALRRAAEESGLSLNEYCARKLAVPGTVAGPTGRVVERAARVCGAALEGVVAFGSWARDEVRGGSDVDVLVVVERGAELRRELYEAWDAEPLEWEGHPIEPHFARLPEPGSPPSGLWAEVAVEGLVLFERGLGVSRWLAEVRGRIAAGSLVRRSSHGHPYWVEAA